LFGVLGSLIMSVLMVGVKRCSSELVGAIHSRLVYLTDFTSHTAPERKKDQLTASLSVVAEQSPFLKALTVALEQSERRVRDLISSLGTLSARIERNEVHLWAELSEGFKANQQGQNAMLENLHQTVQAVREIAREVTPAAYRENAVVAALVSQQNRLESVLQVMEASYGQFSKTLNQQSEVLLRQEQSGQELVQLRQAMADQQRGIQQALNALGNSFASLDSVIREHQELMVHQRTTDDVHSAQLASALREEGEILNRLIGRIEALQYEQGAQQERHLSLLVQELRQQPASANS
jgi:hypothetical protein